MTVPDTDLYKALDEAFPDPSPTPDVEVKAAIERLKEAAEKATPGPWEIREDLGWDEAWCNWHEVGPFSLMGPFAKADGKFIALANPSTILSMIAYIAEIEAGLAGFDDEYMTSEKHHPGHVLIPVEVFDRVRALSTPKGSDEA